MKKQVFLIGLYYCLHALTVCGQNRAMQLPKTGKEIPSSLQAAQSTLPLSLIQDNNLYEVRKVYLQHAAIPIVNLTQTQTIRTSKHSVKDIAKIPATFTPHVMYTVERKKPMAIVLIPRLRKLTDNDFEQLISTELEVIEPSTPLKKTSSSRIYAANSVLSSGTWYKLGVSQRGIYKLDYSALQNIIGQDPAIFNSDAFKIYGNGGGMLAEDNKVNRADDLIENAIQVVDGGDGKINAGDYILWYAKGPHEIIKDSTNKSFTHAYHLYSDKSFYFLRVEGSQGLRIQSAPTTPTPNVTVTSFNDYQFHEKDSVNIGRFGKQFWGDELNDLPGRFLTRSFTFNFPNIDMTSPAQITHVTGGIQHNAASGMQITLNGNAFSSLYYGAFGYEFNDPVIEVRTETKSSTINSDNITLSYTFNKGGSDAVGFIDFIGINARRKLIFTNQMHIADWNSVGPGNIAQYTVENIPANVQVWDITQPLQPLSMNLIKNGSAATFSQIASSLHQFIAFDASFAYTPEYIGKVSNQNLHALSPKDYIIVAHPSLLSEANRLAQHHKAKRNYRILVVTPQEIYNEFSSGAQDITAIRDFVKMLYDKATTDEDMPKYLMLFGDASYDYKDRLANNTNFVPTYETPSSVSKTASYCSDDFFGYLDDEEDLNNYNGLQVSTLDIGIGRVPAPSLSIAKDVVNKIILYDSPATFGAWKNNMTFNADDGDAATHLEDAETMAGVINDSMPVYNIHKIYVDAFVQQSTPGGQRSPDANTAIREQLYNGTFLMNYNGHGGPHSWCDERIFTQNDINSLQNINKLPLFITATCDFAPFDNPADYSAGEILLAKPNGGAIALMTTTQLVYADQNETLNKNYMLTGFEKNSAGKYPTLGDAFRVSKNLKYVQGISEYVASNFRKFALLGDPALPLAFPIHQVITDSINGKNINIATDTLRALDKYTITGYIANQQGQLLPNYNGVVFPVIYDKPKKLTTLQNDGDPKKEYELQNNILFKGKASVKNGRFSFTFVVPKDINYQIAKGKISYYAQNEQEDANGYDQRIYIGGNSSNPISDQQGPTIKAYMNNEKFVDGGVVTANSILFVKLSDDNGINYTGNSIGHDITAVLDANTQQTYVLNNFFEADLDDYRSGTIKFPVNNLSIGSHTFTIKAWDIFNNSADVTIRFEVVANDKSLISRVYNYPNPFSTKTQFMFEHNMPNQDLNIHVQIMTITGKVVKSIRQQVFAEGTRISNIDWDGLDDMGDKLANGTYIYKMHVRNSNGMSDTKLQKLVILR